ncbi:YhcN/YlaJ family sporulation lipoprotein [Brevibacillus ginsengisoli]|uniref:YhcN/YlaJ family sporulation lipoprotein n=1 Tax=Brevibacillus ginsengisoli TaxID=363854 RepID=UPI003CF9EC0A
MKRLLMITSMILLLAACNRANTPPANQAAPNPNQRPAETQRVQQTAPTPPYNQSSQAKAQRLAELASRVKNVNGATAVVLGRYAVVGINIKPTLERSEVGVVKYSVAEALKEDPQGANAIVTADPAIVQRLREMGADIRQGRPVTGIMEELGDIVGRLMPQLPQNVKKREQPNTVENQMKKTNQTNPNPNGTTQQGAKTGTSQQGTTPQGTQKVPTQK